MSVGAHRGIVQKPFKSLHDARRKGVLQQARIFVRLGKLQSQDVNQKPLRDSMPPHDIDGLFKTARREQDLVSLAGRKTLRLESMERRGHRRAGHTDRVGYLSGVNGPPL